MLFSSCRSFIYVAVTDTLMKTGLELQVTAITEGELKQELREASHVTSPVEHRG